MDETSNVVNYTTWIKKSEITDFQNHRSTNMQHVKKVNVTRYFHPSVYVDNFGKGDKAELQ